MKTQVKQPKVLALFLSALTLLVLALHVHPASVDNFYADGSDGAKTTTGG